MRSSATPADALMQQLTKQKQANTLLRLKATWALDIQRASAWLLRRPTSHCFSLQRRFCSRAARGWYRRQRTLKPISGLYQLWEFPALDRFRMNAFTLTTITRPQTRWIR